MGGSGSRRRRTAGGLALACLLGAVAAPAAPSRRLLDFPVVLRPSSLGLPDSVSAAELSRELEAAARAWSYPAVACTSAVFEVAAEPRRRAVRDGSFRVLFRSTSWCHNERCGHLDSYPANVAAMTTLYPETGDGPIAEADIELNGVNVAWRVPDSSEQPSSRTASLRGALLHELGHVLGLRDECPETTESGLGCVSAMLSGDRVQPSATDVRWLCAIYPRSDAVAAAPSAPPNPLGTPTAWTVYAFSFCAGILLLLRRTHASSARSPG